MAQHSERRPGINKPEVRQIFQDLEAWLNYRRFRMIKYDPADLYCKYIENLMNSPDKYRILCNLTFNEYKNNLNWNVAAKSIYKLVSEDHKS